MQMKCEITSDIRVTLPEKALTAIFDECDKFKRDETGGRVIGTFEEKDNELTLRVTGIIESGPQASRSPVSFFQDGKHQERVFRQIEERHPEIEHLGNWHTHHVNGLQTLSSGDVDTYSRTVNHSKHNTPFFYALLVTAKHRTADPLRRYSVRHYVFRRGDSNYYEIPPELVDIVDEPLLWPFPETTHISLKRGAMDILTLYVGQGALAAVRAGNEAVIIDAHMPNCDDVTQDQIEQTLDSYLSKKAVRGLILTGLDKDHACPAGVELILTKYEPSWIMYPTCYKDSDAAGKVFNIITRHEKRREKTSRPLLRKSVRVDRVESRQLTGLATNFAFELFSPHMDDMDSSNNSSIVLKLTGLDQAGFSYLITGDTETARWDSINRFFGKHLASDVMAASHHGARTGLNPATLLLVNPNTVLISAGVDNSYGHPDGSAVKVYGKVAKHVFSTTAEDGMCLLTRRLGVDFETQLVQHFAPLAARS
jgi:beta-lactamase superfamily II metal-dependent hydrolase